VSFCVAALALATLGLHDGPDPIAAWDFQPRYLDAQTLKSRIGPNATVIGSPMPGQTALGQCLVLNGKSDRFVAAADYRTARQFLPTQKFTVEAWAAINMGQNDGSFMGVLQDNGSFEKGWSLGYNGSKFTFALSTKGADDGNGKLTYLAGKTDYVIGKFYHVLGCYDGKVMRLYVNGKLESESTAQSGDILYPETAVWSLGAYKDDDEEYPLEGRLASAALYDMVATPSGVSHLFDHRKEIALAEPVVQENPNFEWVVAPYQQFPTQDEITIMWETSRPASSAVYFGPNKANLTKVEGSVTRNPQSIIHKVVLKNLKPDSHYVYKIETVDDKQRKLESKLLTFRTAPQADKAIRFTVVGDTQDQPKVNTRIAEHMWNERPDFFMIVGDLVGTGANKRHWTNDFFASMRPLFDRVPLIPVLGNHEGDARLYYDYMAVPAPEYWYRFTYGPAEFFVVDSNRDVSAGSEQYRWLEAALASSKSKWKFVAHHHPPYSSDEDDFGNLWEGQSTRGDTRLQAMTKLYERYGVDVVWTGHIHSYERTWPIMAGRAAAKGPTYVVCGGGGGGLETHGPTRPEFSNRIRHGHHYCVVSINGGVLEMSAFDIEGRMFDNLRIAK
jgi:predicted phosphodiesterase